jgi:hypothetical protein
MIGTIVAIVGMIVGVATVIVGSVGTLAPFEIADPKVNMVRRSQYTCESGIFFIGARVALTVAARSWPSLSTG